MFWRWSVLVFFLTPCLCQKQVLEKIEYTSSKAVATTVGGKEEVLEQRAARGSEIASVSIGDMSDSDSFGFGESAEGTGSSWSLRHQFVETVSETSVNLSPASLVNGITFDIVQHYKTFVEFYQLPNDESEVQVRLLVRGRNSAIPGSDPQLQIGVASLASGPQIRVTVGDDNEHWLWTYLWLVLSLLVFVVFGLWSLRSSRRRTSLRHTHDVAGPESRPQEWNSVEKSASDQATTVDTAGERSSKDSSRASRSDAGLIDKTIAAVVADVAGGAAAAAITGEDVSDDRGAIRKPVKAIKRVESKPELPEKPSEPQVINQSCSLCDDVSAGSGFYEQRRCVRQATGRKPELAEKPSDPTLHNQLQSDDERSPPDSEERTGETSPCAFPDRQASPFHAVSVTSSVHSDVMTPSLSAETQRYSTTACHRHHHSTSAPSHHPTCHHHHDLHHSHCHHHHQHHHHHQQQHHLYQPASRFYSSFPSLSSLLSLSLLPSSPRSSSSSSPCRHVRQLLLLSLTLAALTAVTVGVSSMKKEYTLEIGVPQSAKIRKVRAFSENPKLSELARSQTGLGLVSRLQMLDVLGCLGNLAQCQTVAVCDGGPNDMLCRCRRGYYFRNHQCNECSKSCPNSHYLITPCTANADAVCKACTKCSGSQYEAAVCTTTRDTICVDVTFPVGILPMNETQLKDDGTPISAAHSKNVFMERLVDMKELETPMYVTNNQQTQDFVWHRESGIDIVVSIFGVYLIPEYRELDDVQDDSQYFLRQMDIQQKTKDLYTETTKSYCQHPVPDYYYLHLEVIKNRTAAAQVIRCDSQDPNLPRCPKSFKDGDRFLKWDINKACDKYSATGDAPEPLTPLEYSANTVVCTDETSMDRKVFHLSRPVTLEMMFPSTACSMYRQQCLMCLAGSTCAKEGDDKSCCGVPCYNQKACQQFHSPSCPPVEVECASGEVHVFTLLPMFPSMEEEFRCHLRYQRPEYLYNVTYTLSIPGLDFKVPTQTYTASTTDDKGNRRSLRHHQRHSDTFHFIQVWHDTRMPFHEDLLLKGNHAELQATSENHMQPFVVHSLKRNEDFQRHPEADGASRGGGGGGSGGGRGGFLASKSGASQYATAVQFERPFLYSSTSWRRGGCDKNVSQVFPNQTLYNNDAMRVSARKVGEEGDYAYQISHISHTDHSPYIKLTVREGESVLRWFQGKEAKGTIVGDKLTGSLAWDAFFNHWTIGLTGAVENCPAILTLQIFNKMLSACAGIYDLIVTCPNNFSLSFNVSRTAGDLPDIFVLFLNDSQASHRLVLSSVLSPLSLGPSSHDSATAERLSRAVEAEDVAQWAWVFTVLILSFIALIIVFIVYLTFKRRAAKAAAATTLVAEASNANDLQADAAPTLNNQPNNSSASAGKSSAAASSSKQASGGGAASSRSSPPARKCLCVFVLLYVLYSFVFTFSVTLLVLYFTHHALIGQLVGVGDLANFSARLQHELNASFDKVRVHESLEEVRLYSAVDARLEACAVHLQRQNRQFLQAYHDSVTDMLTHVFRKDGAIESLTSQSLLQNTSVYAAEIEQFLVYCNKTVRSILERFDSHFVIHMKDTVRNSWLDFPREVFLAQEGDRADRKYMSTSQLADFLLWLQVDKTEELFSVSSSSAARLASFKLPSATEHLRHSGPLTSLTDDFSSTLPPEPMVASDTFLVLDRPASASASPIFHTPTSTQQSAGAGSHAKAAFLYSEGSPKSGKRRSHRTAENEEDGQEGNEENPADGDDAESSNISVSNVERLVVKTASGRTRGQRGVEGEEEGFSLLVYVMIGLFLTLDVLLFVFRISWMVNQVKAAKVGYEDRIPTDPVSQKLLAIQTGYHPRRMQDMYHSFNVSAENKDTAVAEEPRSGSESEFNVYFCQSYPKSKDDILREIMAHKMNSTEQNLGQERPPDPGTMPGQQYRQHKPKGLTKLEPVRQMFSCFRWLHRMLVSDLVWRFMLTAITVLFLCLVVYAAHFWLTANNLRVLVGGQSALRDLYLQVHMTNRHLASLASHLSAVLQDHSTAVRSEVSLSTALLSTTLQTQRELLSDLLERVCEGATAPVCNLSSYSSLPLPNLPTWQGCNFLPAQPHFFQAELSAGNFELMLAQQLSPLLGSIRRSLFTLCAIVVALLCLMFLCHASATVARYYMLIWGHFPRVAIFQISENTSLMYDGGGVDGDHRPMQRSASWLESCESGVYVGESEMDAGGHPNTRDV